MVHVSTSSFHWYVGQRSTNEKKLVDLMSLRMRTNETPLEYLRRFRETKNMCYSLNLPDDQLPGIAIAGMLPNIREKLFGLEFDDLGQLAQRLAAMSNQAQGFRRDNRFQKNNATNEVYQGFLDSYSEHSAIIDRVRISVMEATILFVFHSFRT